MGRQSRPKSLRKLPRTRRKGDPQKRKKHLGIEKNTTFKFDK